MPHVLFLPENKSIEVPAGASLAEAARMAGAALWTPCGGEGTCGRCAVRVRDGRLKSGDTGIISPQAADSGWMLACQARLEDDSVTVEVPQKKETGGVFVDSFEGSRALELGADSGDQPVFKRQVCVPPGGFEDGLSDLDRLCRCLSIEGTLLSAGPRALRAVPKAVREQGGRAACTVACRGKGYSLIAVEPGHNSRDNFGVAVDIGTTTIALQLIDLTSGRVAASRACYNGQLACGADVISRINYAQRAEGLSELRERVVDAVNKLLHEAAETAGIPASSICSAAVSGNTTMTHLFLGVNPNYLRMEPYSPAFLGALGLAASETGLQIHPEAPVYISPCVGSWVGGDITAGVLASGLGSREEISVFLDVGTNGELVVGGQDFLVACACSAGPAFEGGGVEQGMRAAAGAIERVTVDPESGRAQYKTIGGTVPRGICGSGMISLLAALYETGWMDRSGRLERAKTSPALSVQGRRAAYCLMEADEKRKAAAVTVTEIDLQNIIRAKAAIYSACCLMLDQVGLEFDDVGRFYIAGGFGRFLDVEKAITIGMLPELPREKFFFLGNASLQGTARVLLSNRARQEQQELARRTTYFELSGDARYMEQYTAAMFIPHTDSSRFPSAGRR